MSKFYQNEHSPPYEKPTKLDIRKKNHAKHLKRVQYAFVLLFCTGVLLFQTFQCVEKYLLKSTGTADKYVHVSKTSFPVMTICPTYPYKLDRLQYHGVMTKSDIQFGAQWVSNDSNVSPIDFYKDVVLSVDEVIKEMGIWSELIIDGKNSFKVGPQDQMCGEPFFKVSPYYYNGDCFSMELPTCLREAGVLELNIDFFDKTDIFIHHPGQFLSPNSRSRVDVDLGKFVKIAVNHEVVQLLSEDGQCVDNYGDDEDFDHCMYTKLTEITTEAINCTVPWMLDKSKICSTPETMAQAFKLYQANRRNQKDICPSSCLFTNMYFGPPVTGDQNMELQQVARAVFYFRRDVKTTTEYYLYLALSMLAEIGGYVGLLLGVSLFKLAEMNNSFIDWYHTDKKTGKRQRDIDGVMLKKANLSF